MLTPPKDAEITNFKTSVIWFENDIIYAISKQGERSLEETKQTLDQFKKLIGDKKVRLLIDVTDSPETPREVRDYAAVEFPKFIKAIAMVSDSALGKMVANLFFTIKTQPYPTKFFNDVKKAEQWLENYK